MCIRDRFPNAPPAPGQTIHPTTASASATVQVRGVPPPPPNVAPSGLFGTVKVCNPGSSSAPLVLVAKLVTPTSGATGVGSMSETDTIMLSVLGIGVWQGSFHTNQTYEQGVWQITSAQVQGITGQLPGLPLTINLPGAAGSPVLPSLIHI